jgi:hypothetical protein
MLCTMRTTLNIDNDLLAFARTLARQQKTSTGSIISGLAKEALAYKREIQVVKGVPVFAKPRKGVKVTLALVNRLSEEE